MWVGLQGEYISRKRNLSINKKYICYKKWVFLESCAGAPTCSGDGPGVGGRGEDWSCGRLRLDCSGDGPGVGGRGEDWSCGRLRLDWSRGGLRL